MHLQHLLFYVIVISMKTHKSLYSLLFEDVESDVAAAAAAGPGAVRKLVNSTPDKKELKSVLQGMYDEVQPDDKISVGGGSSMSVSKLIPTQNEIDLMKSVAFPLGGLDALKQMISSNTSGAPGSITISGNEVLDGHHRWSGVWGISGPGGVISTQNIDLPGDTSQKLAAAQLAIAAYKPESVPQPSAEGEIPYNILGKDKETIKKMLIGNVGKQVDSKAPGAMLNDEMLAAAADDKVVADWAGYEVGASVEDVKDAIIEKVAENLGGAKPIPSNPKAPARADMPQFDDKSIGGSAAKEEIYAGFKSGDFNIVAPFAKEKKESIKKNNDSLIMERWQKLAGLI